MQLNKSNLSPWKYFTRSTDAGICNINKCGKKVKAAGGSTSGLHTHFRTIHKINLLKIKMTTDGADNFENKKTTSNSTSTITSYFKQHNDDSLQAVISRMVAKDMLPFSTFCTSEDLRNMLQSKGHIPICPKAMKKMVMEFAETLRIQSIEKMQSCKNKSGKISITLDEWSSTRNRRYMNVIVHDKNKFWNLGLARVHGSMPAEKCVDILKTKLLSFNLSLADFVASTTDGASVMKKFGQLSGIGHQLCIVHGIHLAVVNVLY